MAQRTCMEMRTATKSKISLELQIVGRQINPLRKAKNLTKRDMATTSLYDNPARQNPAKKVTKRYKIKPSLSICSLNTVKFATSPPSF